MLQNHDIIISYGSLLTAVGAITGLTLCYTSLIFYNTTYISIFAFLLVVAVVLLYVNCKNSMNKKYADLSNYLTTFASESTSEHCSFTDDNEKLAEQAEQTGFYDREYPFHGVQSTVTEFSTVRCRIEKDNTVKGMQK